MIIKFIKQRSAFSLLEILITVTLLVILAIAFLVILNPIAQINKGQDSKRKHELAQLNKEFEDFYNDKNCYPKPAEVCYNAGAGTTCNICGSETTSPSFSPYLSRLPCDPRQPLKKYLYQVDSTTCPTWYRIYTTLSYQSDPIIVSVGCQYGCGLPPSYNYNYGVSSPNTGLQTNTNFCSRAIGLYINPFCNICGGVGDGLPPAPYEKCKISHPGETYFTDPSSCTTICIKD